MSEKKKRKVHSPKPPVAHQQPEKLFSEIGKLKMELDWLKKSLGYACHEAPILDRQKA